MPVSTTETTIRICGPCIEKVNAVRKGHTVQEALPVLASLLCKDCAPTVDVSAIPNTVVRLYYEQRWDTAEVKKRSRIGT